MVGVGKEKAVDVADWEEVKRSLGVDVKVDVGVVLAR